jgi:putative chitinase
MVTVDREEFYDGLRHEFGRVMQSQVDPLEKILNFLEVDPNYTKDTLPELAYTLATIRHETASTYKPVREYGTAKRFEKLYGYNTKVGKALGNTLPGEGSQFCGRGFVQLTGKRNYKLASRGTGYDLVKEPDLACDEPVAWRIISEGMWGGWFSGKSLKDYRHANYDYLNARAIVNGTDRAELIAGYARSFERILGDSL